MKIMKGFLLIICALTFNALTASAQTNYETVFSFGDFVANGTLPQSPLIEGSDGSLYGTTSSCGTHLGGTIFIVNKDGTGYSVLYNFASSTGDGRYPQAGLLMGTDGMLYGTTESTLASVQDGTAFRLGQDGSAYAVLHTFTGNPGGGKPVDGSNPVAPLLEGSDGALYGTTGYGGTNGEGTVFKMNMDGSGYIVIHSFAVQDGTTPYGGWWKAAITRSMEQRQVEAATLRVLSLKSIKTEAVTASYTILALNLRVTELSRRQV